MRRLFDKKWYLQHYPEANSYNKGAFKHYIDIGWRKNYNPSGFFSTSHYLKDRPDVREANICPLIHYYRYGLWEGAKIYPSSSIYKGNYKKRPFMFLPRTINKLLWKKDIKKNKNKKILVILHLFYINAFKEIKYYLQNLSCYKYDLVISYVENYDYGTLFKEIKRFKKDVVFVPVKNLGYDIWPFIKVLKETNLDSYDIVFKIQSKRTEYANLIYGNFFKNRDWFLCLFDGILGPYNVHKTVSSLTSNERIGLSCSQRLIVSDSEPKLSRTKKRLKELGITISDDYCFVSGTCFAIKKEIAERIKELDVKEENFTRSSYRGFFSNAHALERYIGNVAKEMGYLYQGNHTGMIQENKWNRLEEKLRKLSGIRIISELPIKMSEEFKLRCLDNGFIRDYGIEKIRVGDLFSLQPQDLKAYHLDELAPFRYLKSVENREEYIRYCETGRRSDYLNLSDDEFKEKIREICCERFDRLIEDLNQNGYNENEPIIIEKNTNRILDGTHRACWIMNKYGKDKMINVLSLDVIHFDMFSARPFLSYLKELHMNYQFHE